MPFLAFLWMSPKTCFAFIAIIRLDWKWCVSSEGTRRKEVLAYRTVEYTERNPKETSEDPKKTWKN